MSENNVTLEDFDNLEEDDFISQEEVEDYYSEESYYEAQEGIAEEYRKIDEPQASDYDPNNSDDIFDKEVTPDYEPEGFTGEVRQSVFVTKKYPHIEIIDTEGISKLNMKMLTRMLGGFKTLGNEYPVYIESEDRLYEIGKLQDYQVVAFINIMGEDKLIARLTESRELKGHMIYTLSN